MNVQRQLIKITSIWYLFCAHLVVKSSGTAQPTEVADDLFETNLFSMFIRASVMKPCQRVFGETEYAFMRVRKADVSVGKYLAKIYYRSN